MEVDDIKVATSEDLEQDGWEESFLFGDDSDTTAKKILEAL